MDRIKILIICKGFFPEINPRAFRATELAKEFSRQGHEVTVILPNADLRKEFAAEHGVKLIDLGYLKWKAPSFGKSRIGYHTPPLDKKHNYSFNSYLAKPACDLEGESMPADGKKVGTSTNQQNR